MKNKGCKDCKKREPGCHARCEVYAAYRAELDGFAKQERDYMESIRVSEAKKKRVQRYLIKRGIK